jgi:hypothetical protein
MEMNRKLRAVCSAAAALAGALLSAVAANATDYAYMITGRTARQFGVVDLSTGVFSVCGTIPIQLAGLGVGPDHQLYGGAYTGSDFYRIDLRNGALTLIGISSINFFLQGSTPTGLYAIGTDSNLYTIDASTGATTLVGPLGLTIDDAHTWGMSTNSKTLYMTENATLIKINTSTGRARKIGGVGPPVFGSATTEHNILYGGDFNPSSIDTIDPHTGQARFLSNLSGEGGNPWGLAPIAEQSISAARICKPHRIP